ncbi:hypothetical protein [Spiroplasma endosymbiont of Polydrusus pterygomalis]|uniref:hypothetical protein n=1 Tax=Spiroplasma endosymbiont of Polydrusus pterygomalis TaxID=3139327 RepID=UPI003CCAF925
MLIHEVIWLSISALLTLVSLTTVITWLVIFSSFVNTDLIATNDFIVQLASTLKGIFSWPVITSLSLLALITTVIFFDNL